MQELILKLFPPLNTTEGTSTDLPREAGEKSIASIATNVPDCHDSRLQLGPIATISHSLQVSGLDNAGTTARSYSQSICQAVDGLIIPLPPSQFITVQRDRGWTRILLPEFVWGFVGFFWLTAYIFTTKNQSAMLFHAFPGKGLFLTPEKCFAVFKWSVWFA